MKNAWIAVFVAASACGPAAVDNVKHPEGGAPALPAYQVARSTGLQSVFADATHVYWIDAGIHRMEHGPGHTAERIYATDTYVYDLAIGTSDIFFVDESSVVRALPKAGGAPTEIHTFEGGVWGLAADGDGVWVGIENRLERWSREPGSRTLKLPAPGSRFVIADGVAYVTSYDQPKLVAVELAGGKTTTLSDEWYFGDSQGLAVSGKSVLSAYSEGVVAIPRGGGKPKLVFASSALNVVGDADGYVALGYSWLIEHHSGRAPHVLDVSRTGDYLGATRSLALGGGYAYHVDSDDVGAYVLTASPRNTGPTLMRLPLGAYVSTLAASGKNLFAMIEDERGPHVAKIGERRTATIADTAGYVEGFTANEGTIAYYQDGVLHSLALQTKQDTGYPNDISGGFGLTIHKGRLFMSTYGQIYTTKIGAPGSSRMIADVTQIPGVAGDVQISAMRFASDHLYFAIPWVGQQGLGRVDEEGHTEMVWTYAENGYHTLQPDFVIIGETAYLHDETSIYAVPLDGGEARTLAHHDAVTVSGLYRAGNHLIARLYTPKGDTIVELSRKTGKVRTLWSGYSADGAYASYFAVGDDAIYMYVGELYSVLKIEI